MGLFQKMRNKILISIRRKKHYSMHYKMWDYIVAHLQSDSDELLNDANYIGRLKKMFIKAYYNRPVYLDCFLCDLHFDKSEKSCDGCPLCKLQNTTCLNPNSLFIIMHSRFNKRAVRVEAAKKIRDCVLGKEENNEV